MKSEPELPFDRCIHCNSILPWPGVPFASVERKIFDTINHTLVSVPTTKHLARMLDMTFGNVRANICRMNKKLEKKGLKILTRPVRVIHFNELQNTPATPIAGTPK